MLEVGSPQRKEESLEPGSNPPLRRRTRRVRRQRARDPRLRSDREDRCSAQTSLRPAARGGDTLAGPSPRAERPNQAGSEFPLGGEGSAEAAGPRSPPRPSPSEAADRPARAGPAPLPRGRGVRHTDRGRGARPQGAAYGFPGSAGDAGSGATGRQGSPRAGGNGRSRPTTPPPPPAPAANNNNAARPHR